MAGYAHAQAYRKDYLAHKDQGIEKVMHIRQVSICVSACLLTSQTMTNALDAVWRVMAVISC